MTRDQALNILLNLQRNLKLSEDERNTVKNAIATLYTLPEDKKTPLVPVPGVPVEQVTSTNKP